MRRWTIVAAAVGVFTVGMVIAAVSITRHHFRNEPLVNDTNGAGGVVCVPVGDEHRASIAWEPVRNASKEAVTVTDVSLAGKQAKVVNWVLTKNEWSDAGVRKRDLPDPGDARLPNTVGPGKVALVAFTVQADHLVTPMNTRVWVSYRSPKGRGHLRLVWRVRFMPRGQTCDMSSDE